MPDCFEPPNGVRRSRRNHELIQTMPALMAEPRRKLRPTSQVHTVAARPYGVSFASRTASSSLSNGDTWQHGPKISSRTTAEVSGNPVQMVGSIHAPPDKVCGIDGIPP